MTSPDVVTYCNNLINQTERTYRQIEVIQLGGGLTIQHIIIFNYSTTQYIIKTEIFFTELEQIIS